jgi:hypothetical protein
MTVTKLARRVLVIAPIVLAGGLLGYQFGHWLKAVRGLEGVSAADAGGLLLGIALLVQGLVVLVISLTPGALGRILGGEGRWPVRPGQRAFWRLQAAVLLLAGGMMAAPVIASLTLGDPPPRLLSMSVMAGIVAAFALQSALNLVVWRQSDEFIRRLISETSVVCFWVLQSALFLWAAGERLGLVSGLTAWSGAVIMMAVYLVASTTISLRNGMAS